MNRASHVFLIQLYRLIPWTAKCSRLTLLAAGLVLAINPALSSTNGITPYRVRIWQTDEGLPQNTVHAIAQTPDGYLWVGTREGLARFDGVRFTLLDDDAPAELRHGWITALCAGRDGSLWIAADGYGLARLKGGSSRGFPKPTAC